jgi:putative colanic acid biosynthesis UDP-glucose lipid carrier transferase
MLNDVAQGRSLEQRQVQAEYVTHAHSEREATRIHVGSIEPALVGIVKRLLDPVVVLLSLMGCLAVCGAHASLPYSALGLLAALLTQQVVSPAEVQWSIVDSTAAPSARLLWEWSLVIALLLFVGFVLKSTTTFDWGVLVAWFVATPVALLLVRNAFERAVKWLAPKGAAARTHVVVGANKAGRELARRLETHEWLGTFAGFFDDRDLSRLPGVSAKQMLGKLADVAEYVRRESTDVIYIALPMSGSQRIMQLLSELRDTTASVYFVPDIFVTDLIQARFVDMNGIPVVSICETPFHGRNALLKRATDFVLASICLIGFAPLMALLALLVKLSSAGPVIFKQRRYGLDGEQILVYKFRSMTVCEDGTAVEQATRSDSRVTPIGRLLRKTSLDELPQLLNVLQGRMSLVGPRPHAVAHNEMYRKLIHGYMLRHKIRPGMTGWAQVHGLRGETDTVDKMRRRVEYDLDYLRHWSVWLDVKILFRTLRMITDRSAY